MSDEIMVGKALETNSLQSTATSSGYLNPTIWATKIEDYAVANIVIAQLGVVYNELMGGVGSSINVEFATALTAAALTESTAMTPSAITYTQRTFTPTEYGLALAITRKERIRSINDIMADKTRDAGIALATLKDSVCASVLQASAGSQVTVNGVAVASLTTSDTLDTNTIANAIATMRKNNRAPKYLVIHPACEVNLLKSSQFVNAATYGGREVVLNGEIGTYLGIKVLVTTLVPANGTNASCYDNFLLADRAFGIANKMPVTVDGFYKVLEREFILGIVEEYDVKILNTDCSVKVTAYKGI